MTGPIEGTEDSERVGDFTTGACLKPGVSGRMDRDSSPTTTGRETGMPGAAGVPDLPSLESPRRGLGCGFKVG